MSLKTIPQNINNYRTKKLERKDIDIPALSYLGTDVLSLIADYDYVFTGQCQCVSTLKGHTKNVSCVTVLPNGCIVSGSRDSTLRIWDPDSWKCILILQVILVL